MTFDEFRKSLSNPSPPAHLSEILKAMWHDGNDNWEKAHNIAQDIHTKDASWIHAYLHRKEGDHGNASYWYHRANKPVPSFSLQEEWEKIVRALLAQ